MDLPQGETAPEHVSYNQALQQHLDFELQLYLKLNFNGLSCKGLDLLLYYLIIISEQQLVSLVQRLKGTRISPATTHKTVLQQVMCDVLIIH